MKTTKFNNNNFAAIGGGLIVVIGLLLLAKQFGLELPNWIFSWKMFLIALGVYIGLKNNFKDNAWIVLVLIGSIFLIIDWFDDYDLQKYIWPIGVIVFGLYLIVKSKTGKKFNFNIDNSDYFSQKTTTDFTQENLEITSIFSGVKRTVLNKNFTTGNITVIFGGAEVNLLEADILQLATLDITQLFGGTKLKVPANWKIVSELTSVFGSIDDKRFKPQAGESENKTLILKGTSIFGGIEIISF